MSQSRSRDRRVSARRDCSAHLAKASVSRARSMVSRYFTPSGTAKTAEGLRRPFSWSGDG
jgi:hypothetical protein